MKICLLTRYFDFRNAGLGRVSKEIAMELQRRGHEVVKVSTNGESLYSYAWYMSIGIRSQIPDNCDVYHALTPMEAVWIPKEKSVVTFHDLIPLLYQDKAGAGIGRSPLKSLLGKTFFKTGCDYAKRCKYVVCVSDKTKQDMITSLGVKKDKIRIIRSGIDSRLRPMMNFSQIFTIGYLGQLDRRKRVDLLIKEFKSSNIHGELLIAGTGADEKMLKGLAEGDSRIKFLGFIPDAGLSRFYNSLNVFIFPTMVEGYGLPIVEAMVCRKPVVVLKDAIIPDEVKGRCIVVDNLSSFFKSGRSQSPEEYDDNYEWAKSHSWKKCVDDYLKIYEEIL